VPSSRCRVTRTRASKLCEVRAPGGAALAVTLVTLIAWSVSCGATRIATIEAPSLAPSGDAPHRKPDAVVVEPPPAMPSAAARAEARGVVALREPLGDDAVRDLVLSLVDAWQRESIDALSSLLTPDAGPFEARARGRAALIESWRQRMRAHPYGRLAGADMVRPERIEHWDLDELAWSNAPARPPDMRPGEVYVRVPLEVTRLAGEKLFSDVIVLVVRREDAKYRIVAYGEVDLP
jgi:hypothetical protein